jgi:hypothetical protein
MLLLPSHQDRHYEPLFSPPKSPLGRILQRKYTLVFALAGLLATIQVLRLCLLSSSYYSPAAHHIPEEEWHMPADVVLADTDSLWDSRIEPFFRQVDGNLHRELGYGRYDANLDGVPHVRRSLYRHLLQSFHSFSAAHSFHFWLAHGSLLGQHW